ncbi:hypothetical protein J0H58_34050 [bacterium]|nr:hypothetical protein [bacterium]
MPDDPPDRLIPDLEKPAREVARGVFKGAIDVWNWLRGNSQVGQKAGLTSRGILVLGPGGAGKTTFARLIAGDLDWLHDAPGQYEESVGLEHFTLDDDPGVEVVVAPGQDYRRQATWPGLLRQVATGVYRGVVLVNAFGHHTFSAASYKHHQLFKTTKEAFLTVYFADRRAEEVRVLRQLVPHLSVCPKPVWLLSIVSKQDLWWSHHGEAEAHYQQGEYANATGEIARALGDRGFRHELAFLAMTLRNLETDAGERLVQTEAGYDMRRVKTGIHQLIRVLAELKAWEARS